MKRLVQTFLLAILIASGCLSMAGCGTPSATQWPEVDRISQRQQVAETAGGISNSPYVR